MYLVARIMVALVAAVAGLALGGSVNAQPDPGPTAIHRCHDAITDQLMHPDSADFGVYQSHRYDDGAYGFTGNFTAKASWGATVVARFACYVPKEGQAAGVVKEAR